MSETKLSKRGRTLLALGLGTAVTASAITGLELQGDGSKNTAKHEQVTAVSSARQILNAEIVLKSGVNVRLLPQTQDGTTPKDGMPNDITTVVPMGKEWVITDPLTQSDSGWIGFTRPGVDPSSIHSVQERAADTVWVNLGLLQSQNMADLTQYKGELIGGFNANILNDGSIQANGLSDHRLAVSFEQSASDPINIVS